MPVTLLPCVIDSNILIDLVAGKILPGFFQLPLYLLTTRFVVDELHEPDGQLILNYGVTVCGLSTDEITEMRRLGAQHRRLSSADISAFILARRMQVTLLTGDSRVRALAHQHGINVRGSLWVLDEMVRLDVIAPLVASEALVRVLRGGGSLTRGRMQSPLDPMGLPDRPRCGSDMIRYGACPFPGSSCAPMWYHCPKSPRDASIHSSNPGRKGGNGAHDRFITEQEPVRWQADGLGVSTGPDGRSVPQIRRMQNVFMLHVFNTLTTDSGGTWLLLGEYGAVTAAMGLLLALLFWRLRTDFPRSVQLGQIGT